MSMIINTLKVAWITFLIVTFHSTSAQQSILLNQASYNLFTTNPAAMGLNSNLNLNAHYKKNWLGLSESPQALQITIDGKVPKSKMGLGLNLINESAGIYSKSSVSGAFNYKLKFVNEHFIYLGLSVGFQKLQSDFSKIKADKPEEFSQWSSQQAVTKPDASIGFVYVHKKFILAVSALQLLQQNYAFKEPVYNSKFNYSAISYFVFSLQYKIDIKKNEWQMIPQICLRTPKGLPIQADFLNTFVYRDKLLIGLGFRMNYAVYTNMGYSVSDKLRIVYSYEYGLSIQSYTKGGHEIGIKYTFSESDRNHKAVIGNNSDEPIDQLCLELDAQKQNMVDLNKKIDSLDRNLQGLMEQIRNLKNQQIESDEMTSLNLNQQKKDESNQQEKNNSLQNRKISPQKNQKDMYNRINSGDEDEVFKIKDTLVANYQIVLGVYQLLNYAKDYQKFLKRELGFETDLFQMPDHPKNFIYVTLVKKYNNLDTALKDLEKTNAITRSKSIEITKGESWVLQTRIK